MLAQVIVDIVHENVAHDFTYRIPEGMSLSPGQRVLVPFGRQKKEGIVVSLSQTADISPDRLRDIIAPLEDYPAVLPALLTLSRQMAEENHCPLAETLRLMLPAEMRGSRVHVKRQTVAELTCGREKLPEAVAACGRSRKKKLLLSILSDEAPHPVDELKLLVRDPLDPLKEMQEAGWLRLYAREVLRRPEGDADPVADPPLMPSQQEALTVLLPGVEKGEGSFLLHGVTGSGKTEVFIRLVRQTLLLGKGAMILVPEIALTPQMVSWFRSRFGPVAAVLHSRLSPGERYDEWRRIRRGDARVVIGARSAVFAPLEKLGLIVVDEEHESTYLSDRHPRYDARQVARRRCENEGGALVLASATPSILSFAMARRGDLTLVEMPVRVLNRPMPQVTILDMRRELEMGNRSIFSQALQEALLKCVSGGNQAMLLMNHRGYHSFVSCRKCGQAVKCPNCDIALTYHVGSSDNRLHCHYCGHSQPVPELCPECGSTAIRFFGAGTQRVEEEVRRLLPGVGVVRMDIDTTSGKDGHRKLLDEFRSGRARVLVGTQMIAKGLDFPQVTLVGVIAADMTLNLPDYRSRERTFQLLTQVAGRAGRGSLPGEVIIQTYKPEDDTIRFAADQDYRAFFENEFARRRRGLYPPFTMMTRLLVEANHEVDARETAEKLYARCQSHLEGQPLLKKRVLMLLLDQPSVKLLRGKSRWHVLMKLLVHPDTQPFLTWLTEVPREEYPGCQVYLEIDPINMM